MPVVRLPSNASKRQREHKLKDEGGFFFLPSWIFAFHAAKLIHSLLTRETISHDSLSPQSPGAQIASVFLFVCLFATQR